MIEEYQKWLEYLAHLEETHKDELSHPIYKSVFIAFGELKFNNEHPLADCFKSKLITTFNLIYHKKVPCY